MADGQPSGARRTRDRIRSLLPTRYRRENASPNINTSQPSTPSLPQQQTQQSNQALTQPADSQSNQALTQSSSSQSTQCSPGIANTVASPPTGSTGMKLWDEAFRKLPEDERHALASNCPASKLDIIDAALQTAEKRKEECDKRKWKIEVGDRSFVVRDLMAKIVQCVNKFKEIGDVAVSFDPVHAALPWAGVRFLLEVFTIEINNHDGLIVGLEKVAHLINRCRIYEILHLQDRTRAKIGSTDSAANLEHSLIRLYSAMLAFLARACKQFGTNQLPRSFKALMSPKAVVSFIADCKDMEAQISMDAENCEQLRARNNEGDRTELNMKLQQMLKDLQTPMLRVDSMVTTLCTELQQEKQGQILMWVSGLPYSAMHSNACMRRTPDTGQWLLNHDDFTQWRSSSSSSILWLNGPPGTGKSKLISRVVDELQREFSCSPNSETLAYFYCDRNQGDRRKPDNILRSFVKQLATVNGTRIPKVVSELYSREQMQGFPSGPPDWDACNSLLMELSEVYPQTTIVLDALDECEVATRQRLINGLDNLVSKSAGLVKVLIASRPDEDLKHRYHTGPNVEITSAKSFSDIKKYIHKRLESQDQYRWRSWMNDEIIENIQHTLLEKSQGSFQWVALQLDQVLALKRPRDVKQRLGKLPTNLEKAYDEIFERILNRGSMSEVALRAFHWVACSILPLRSRELVPAVCQDAESDGLDEVDLDIDRIFGACQNLLKFIEGSENIGFTHLSVQEYFELRYCPQQSHRLVATVCLKMVNEHELLDREIETSDTPDLLSLVSYAQRCWVQHVQQSGDQCHNGQLEITLSTFLGPIGSSTLAFKKWINLVHARPWDFANHFGAHGVNPLLLNVETGPYPTDSLGMSFDPNNNIFFVCWAGFYDILADWWRDAREYHAQARYGDYTPLETASLYGHIPIMQHLLLLHAPIETNQGKWGSALSAACVGNQEPAARLLIEKGANANFKRPVTEESPILCLLIHYIVGHHHQSRARLIHTLVEQGVDLESRDRFGYTALERVAHDHGISDVRLLLDLGANVNAPAGKRGHTALSTAVCSYKEPLEKVRLLVDAGAELNAICGPYGSALNAAVHKGNVDVTKLLLDRGADATYFGPYGTALHMAVRWLHGQEIVQLLIDRGADVEAYGGSTPTEMLGTPLQMAARWNNPQVVQNLLENGAKVYFISDLYQDAFEAAFEVDEWRTQSLLFDPRLPDNSLLDWILTIALLRAAATKEKSRSSNSRSLEL